MSTSTTERVEVEALLENDGESTCHVVCVACYPDPEAPVQRGLCGTLLTGDNVEYDTPTTCVVCADLEYGRCPICGTEL